MSQVSRDEIERIAQLACVEIDDASLSTLTEQIAQILDYFAQLASVEATHSSPRLHRSARTSSSFRDDKTAEPERAINPNTFAPVFEQQLFAVPRLGVMENE